MHVSGRAGASAGNHRAGRSIAVSERNPDARQSLSTGLLIGIFLITASGLAFEVALTRAFSVLLRYHFVFLAISLATCGIGIGGLIDYLLARRSPGGVDCLVRRGLALAVLFPFSVYLLFATPLSARLTSVWVVSGICILPFLMSGLLLSRAFALHSSQSGRLYFADLAGAAIGSFGVIAVLQLAGAINAALACGILAAAGAAAIGLGARRLVVGGAGLALAAALCVLLGLNMSLRAVDLPLMPLRQDPFAKPLYQELADPNTKARIVTSEWNAFARTDVVWFANPEGEFDPLDDLYIYTDGEVPTNMIAFDGDLPKLEGRLRSFIGFLPFEQFRPDSVMLIGPGGGLDILLALAVGSERIVGAELNPSIPRIVRQHGEFNGNIYDYANVSIAVDEGRSFMSRSGAEYDLIYMALTKTATTASSSLALVESYIHTQDAFVECLKHLTPDGKIAFVCQEPALLLRTLLTAREALREVGVPYEQSMAHFLAAGLPPHMYVSGPYRNILVISRNSITGEESKAFAERAIVGGLDPVYAPGAYVPVPLSWLAENPTMSPGEFVARYNAERSRRGGMTLNLLPCTDDSPFIVDLSFGVPAQFSRFLIGALLAAVLVSCILLLVLWREGGSRREVGRMGVAVVYFMLLGGGFMLVETALIQKLVLYLGYPVLTLSTLLFAVLISGSLGSLFTQRVGTIALPRVVMSAAAGVVAYGIISMYLYPAVISATLSYGIVWRALITIVMLFPLGFCMGVPFPVGLRVAGEWSAHAVPWLWGVNGLMSVVGSVAAMSLAKLWGFSHVLMVGWAVYVGVFVIAAIYSGSGAAAVHESDTTVAPSPPSSGGQAS